MVTTLPQTLTRRSIDDAEPSLPKPMTVGSEAKTPTEIGRDERKRIGEMPRELEAKFGKTVADTIFPFYPDGTSTKHIITSNNSVLTPESAAVFISSKAEAPWYKQTLDMPIQRLEAVTRNPKFAATRVVAVSSPRGIRELRRAVEPVSGITEGYAFAEKKDAAKSLAEIYVGAFNYGLRHLLIQETNEQRRGFVDPEGKVLLNGFYANFRPAVISPDIVVLQDINSNQAYEKFRGTNVVLVKTGTRSDRNNKQIDIWEAKRFNQDAKGTDIDEWVAKVRTKNQRPPGKLHTAEKPRENSKEKQFGAYLSNLPEYIATTYGPAIAAVVFPEIPTKSEAQIDPNVEYEHKVAPDGSVFTPKTQALFLNPFASPFLRNRTVHLTIHGVERLTTIYAAFSDQSILAKDEAAMLAASQNDEDYAGSGMHNVRLSKEPLLYKPGVVLTERQAAALKNLRKAGAEQTLKGEENPFHKRAGQANTFSRAQELVTEPSHMPDIPQITRILPPLEVSFDQAPKEKYAPEISEDETDLTILEYYARQINYELRNLLMKETAGERKGFITPEKKFLGEVFLKKFAPILLSPKLVILEDIDENHPAYKGSFLVLVPLNTKEKEEGSGRGEWYAKRFDRDELGKLNEYVMYSDSANFYEDSKAF